MIGVEIDTNGFIWLREPVRFAQGFRTIWVCQNPSAPLHHGEPS